MLPLLVNPSTSKMVGCIIYTLFTACLTPQQLNQIFFVVIKTMVYFFNIFSGEASEFISSIYPPTNSTPRITTLSAPYISFKSTELFF